MNPKIQSKFLPIRLESDLDKAFVSKTFDNSISTSFHVLNPEKITTYFSPRYVSSNACKDHSRRHSSILELTSGNDISFKESPKLSKDKDFIVQPLSSNSFPKMPKYYQVPKTCLEMDQDTFCINSKFKSLRRLPNIDKKSNFHKFRKTNSPQVKYFKAQSHSSNLKKIEQRKMIDSLPKNNLNQQSPITETCLNSTPITENTCYTLPLGSNTKFVKNMGIYPFLFEQSEIYPNDTSSNKRYLRSKSPGLLTSLNYFQSDDYNFQNNHDEKYSKFTNIENVVNLGDGLNSSCLKNSHNDIPSISESDKLERLNGSTHKQRKFLSSLKSLKRTILPSQSPDDLSNVTDSFAVSKSPSTLDENNASSSAVNMKHCSCNKLRRLKTSHSADNNLHCYSDFNQLRENVTSKREPSLNFERSLTDYIFSEESNIIAPITSTLKTADNLPNHISPLFNIQEFVPIMRSESTPCICSRNSRIGMKRKAEEPDRPTANFAKMWDSQISPNVFTPDISPIGDVNRFSSCSPDSISDEFEQKVADYRLQRGGKQFLQHSEFDKIDIQSIEEN